MYRCYTEGQLSFGITNLACNGSEKHILNCTHSNPVLYNCQSHSDAGLVCQGIVIPCSYLERGWLGSIHLYASGKCIFLWLCVYSVLSLSDLF